MIAGVAGFLLASFQVSLFTPQEGESLSWAPLLPVIALLLFEILHRRQVSFAIKVRAMRERGELGYVREPSVWRNIFLHQAAFWAILYYGWSQFVQVRLGLAQTFFLPAALMFAPWLLIYTSSLIHRWRLMESHRSDPWPLREFLQFNLRVLVIPLVPCLSMALISWLTFYSSLQNLLVAYPSVSMAIVLGFSLLVVICSPFLIRLAIASETMADGPLRRRFEAVAEKSRFQYLDIRVARTHNRVLNAMFTGVLGRLRYVFMTDAILEQMDEDDLVGVFAHEVGHSKRHHILLYIALFIGLSFFLQISFPSQSLEEVFLGPWLIYPFFIFFVFSPIAKSFESEADAFAGEILGDPGPIKRSLENLGRMYPRRMKDGGMVHPSIEQRVTHLSQYFGDPKVATEFKARLKRVKIMILLFFVLPFSIWLTGLPREISLGAILSDTLAAQKAEDAEAAAAVLSKNAAAFEDGSLDPNFKMRAALWQTVAASSQDQEDFDQAQGAIDEMRANREYFDAIGQYNTSILQAYQAAALGDWYDLMKARRQAEYELAEVIELMPGDPQIADEKADIRLLAGIETIARKLDLVPAAAAPEALASDETPEMAFLRFLDQQISPGNTPKEPSKSEPASLGKLKPGWKRAALDQLRAATAPK